MLAESQHNQLLRGNLLRSPKAERPCERCCTLVAMPNIASVLKGEIARVARKELRDETTALKKASSSHRADIAELKRAVRALEQEVRRLSRLLARSSPSDAPAEPSATRLRFSASGLRAQRNRLGLTANECGLLIGVSGQSIYLWETERARPKDAHLPAIAALRKMGKKEAAKQLAEASMQN
jgi:DNA-binding XRE family transcriptional regulator